MIEQHLTIEQVLERLNMARTTLYELRARHDFPPPIKLSKRRIVWPESAIAKWLSDRQTFY